VAENIIGSTASATNPKPSHKASPATLLQQAEEQKKCCMDRAHALEEILGLEKPWTTTCNEYKLAAILHGRHQYQQCLNELESLIVSCLFELTKANMSQTGISHQTLHDLLF
jgi:hypothetical protein